MLLFCSSRQIIAINCIFKCLVQLTFMYHLRNERLHKCRPLVLSGLLFDAYKMPVQIVPVIITCLDTQTLYLHGESITDSQDLLIEFLTSSEGRTERFTPYNIITNSSFNWLNCILCIVYMILPFVTVHVWLYMHACEMNWWKK